MTAEYSLRKNGDIEVVNTCIQDTLDGEVRKVRGKARVVDKATGARLKVSFFWPFWGSYWVIGLGRRLPVGRRGASEPELPMDSKPLAADGRRAL